MRHALPVAMEHPSARSAGGAGSIAADGAGRFSVEPEMACRLGRHADFRSLHSGHPLRAAGAGIQHSTVFSTALRRRISAGAEVSTGKTPFPSRNHGVSRWGRSDSDAAHLDSLPRCHRADRLFSLPEPSVLPPAVADRADVRRRVDCPLVRSQLSGASGGAGLGNPRHRIPTVSGADCRHHDAVERSGGTAARTLRTPVAEPPEPAAAAFLCGRVRFGTRHQCGGGPRLPAADSAYRDPGRDGGGGDFPPVVPAFSPALEFRAPPSIACRPALLEREAECKGVAGPRLVSAP